MNHHTIPALELAFRHARLYLEGLDEQAVDATVSVDSLRARFLEVMPEDGLGAESVVEELVRNVGGGLTASAGGRCFGWVLGSSLPAALAADWLTSTWDQAPGVQAVSPAGSVVEEVCGRWLLSLLGLPASASFALVTGCQMAHVTALAAARNALLRRQGWDVEEQGLVGAPPMRVVSGRRHGTVERAVRLLGLGRACLVDIPLSADEELSPEHLDAALARSRDVPAVVLLQAGDVNTGHFDDFGPLIDVARHYDAWVHVDGAFGLWAAASPTQRHLTVGVDRADSWATDGHKWLNVPYDCGYAFVRDSSAHFRALSHRAAYLEQSGTGRDAVDWGPEHSRRARGFSTYAALRALGRTGIAELVDTCCRHSRNFLEGAARLPGVELVSAPCINQGLLRFPDPRPGATEAHHDAHTAAVIRAVNASGEALFTSTDWYGRRCMRVSVSSFRTTDGDIARALEALTKAVTETPSGTEA